MTKKEDWTIDELKKYLKQKGIGEPKQIGTSDDFVAVLSNRDFDLGDSHIRRLGFYICTVQNNSYVMFSKIFSPLDSSMDLDECYYQYSHPFQAN